MFRHNRRTLLACATTAAALLAPGGGTGRRPERLERHRAEPRDHAQADSSWPDARDRDGPGRGLRRRQRDRPRPPAVPPERQRRRRATMGIGGRGHCHGRPPRARQARRARPGGGSRRGVHSNTRRDPGRAGRTGRRSCRRGGRGGDARGPGERRVLRAVRLQPRDRPRSRRLEAGDTDGASTPMPRSETRSRSSSRVPRSSGRRGPTHLRARSTRRTSTR